MDLFNAILDSITAPGAPTPEGDATIPPPVALTPAVRCVLDQVKHSQRVSLGALVKEATAVLYVLKSRLPAGVKPAKGYELRVTPDGGARREPPAAADRSPVATTLLAAPEFTWYHPRGWNPNLFPHLNKDDSLSTQQAQWLSDIKANAVAYWFPNAAAVRSTTFLVWDGFSGEESSLTAYNGEPSYYPPEAPQSSKREFTAFCAAHGFSVGECVRPTVLDQVGHTQLYPADPMALIRQKVAAAVADGVTRFWMDSFLKGDEGQPAATGNRFFTKAEVAGLAADFPQCQFYVEWWDPENYPDIPNVWGYHDPAGVPGVAGYDPDAGVLPFDVPDDLAWDAHLIYYDDDRVDPRNPAIAAGLAAAFRRGARPTLYVGPNFAMANGLFTDDQRARIYAIWLDNYPGAPGEGQQVMVAEHVLSFEKAGGLSHYQVFLREQKP